MYTYGGRPAAIPCIDHDGPMQVEWNQMQQQPVIPWLWHGKDRAKSMEPSIYGAVLSDDTAVFEGVLNQHPDLINRLHQVVTSRGDTVLHIAARLNRTQLLEYLLNSCPALYSTVNSNGDQPLHVAAAAGHLSTVQYLIRDRASDQLIAESIIKKNTALHEALQHRNYEVAKLLFRAAPKGSYLLNLHNVYPLYMAAEAGQEELVEGMLQYIVSCPDYQYPYGLPKVALMKDGGSLVHVAIRNRNMGVLEIAYRYEHSLFERYDENNRTPLSTAASMGYLDGVKFILDKFAKHAYDRDPIGWCCPIHMAARRGHVGVIKEFLQRFPDSKELLNGSGQNILHMAAECGRVNVVRYILQEPELEMLINETDIAGNTPLHLATIVANPKVVIFLTWDKRVRLDLKDNKGHTVADVALMSSNGKSPSFRQRLTWLALEDANAPKSKDPIRPMGLVALKHANAPISKDQIPTIPIPGVPRLDAFKDRITSFILVATLIMTVTFTAGLAVPGGFVGSDSDPKGMAVLVKKGAFQTYVITNTTALYSSMVVVIALIWAQMGDLDLIATLLRFSIPLLGLSLTMVSLSFMVGVSLVVSNLSWLPFVVLFVGSISLLCGLTLLLPHFPPSTLKNLALRYMVYYPFCLLTFISELNPKDDIDPDHTEDPDYIVYSNYNEDLDDEYSDDEDSDDDD